MLKWRLIGNSAKTPSDMLSFRAYSDRLEIANCAFFSERGAEWVMERR
jgi:hypothetical protein